MYQRKSNLFRRLAAASVCAALLLSLAACKKDTTKTTAPAETLAAEPVTAEQAIAHLQEQQEALGFDNALDELKEQNTTQIGGDTYIRMQQYYEGIPVYGKTIVYAANEQGQLSSVTGNVQDIYGELDLNPTVTEEVVQSSFAAYAKDKLSHETVDSVSLAFNDENLCVIADDSNSGAALAYNVFASIEENGVFHPYEVVFDAHTGKILSCYAAVYTEWVPLTLEGPGGIDMLVDITVETDADGKSYYSMHDDRRNIHIHSANGATLQFELYNYDEELVRDRNGNILKNEDTLDVYPVWISANGITEPSSYDDPPDFETEAVKLLSNLQTTYDYYEEVFGISGFPINSGRAQIHAFYDDNLNGDTKNAYCWGYAGAPMYTMLFSFGSDNGLSLDTVAHEYTHAIERKRSCMKYEGESGAIMEALSDLFGELVESWATKKDPNWQHAGNRNIKNPSKSKLPESYGGKHWVNPEDTSNDHGGVHYNNTVISHAAYLMWLGPNGNTAGRLSTEELGELWYRAVLMMPSDCDFILCRQLVEVAAQSMEDLTDEQRACIREAFDAVGIPSSREDSVHADYNLAEDCTLTVYDKNKEPYSGYILRISGTIDMKEIASNMTPDIGWVVNRTVTVEEAGPYALDLPQGFYTLTITDPHYDEIYTIYVQISDEHTESNIDLITAYEEPLVVVVPEYAENIFEQLPSEFIFSSGAGAWMTVLNIADDGTFTGEYHDSNYDEVYICNFSGRFSKPEKISEYIYSMNLEHIAQEGTPGDVYYENDIKYIVSDPYGMDNADQFYIYLPGAPISELSDDFLSWAHLGYPPIRETTPAGYFGIYNVGGQQGFVGENKDNIWHKDYIYNYQGRKSRLYPSYSSDSRLTFWPESGAAVLDLVFTWSSEHQTEFDAYDYHGSGDYHITLDINDDLSTVIVDIESAAGVDLSAWGGTSDGHLTAEYTSE